MSAPEIVVITQRQRDIEALAEEIFDARPGMNKDVAKQLASSIIDELDQFEREWDMDSALAYAFQTPRTLAA